MERGIKKIQVVAPRDTRMSSLIEDAGGNPFASLAREHLMLQCRSRIQKIMQGTNTSNLEDAMK